MLQRPQGTVAGVGWEEVGGVVEVTVGELSPGGVGTWMAGPLHWPPSLLGAFTFVR